MFLNQGSDDTRVIRAISNFMSESDYDSLTPYEAENVSKAQYKANKQFDDRIKRVMTPVDVASRKKIVILVTAIIVMIILGTIIIDVLLPRSDSSVSDLGLDAGNSVYVADKANVLDDKVKQQAYDLNKKLEKSDYHAQIMVVVVPDLPAGYSINDYSMAIAEKYKPGNKKQDTGLLYTVAINDHKARLEVGYGLEGKIPDATAAKLQQPANAHYKKHEYSAGVSALLDGVQQLLLDGRHVDDLAVASSYGMRDKGNDTQWVDFVRSLLFSIRFMAFIALIIPVVLISTDVARERERLDRLKNPDKYKTIDANNRNMMLATAAYNVLHPHTYSSSSNGLHDSGWSSGSSSSSGGGDFGGGGATTDW